MLKRERWPYTPERLTEVLDEGTLTVIESGCTARLGRPVTILDYDPQTRGFSARIEGVDEANHYQPFCRLLRNENRIKGGDEACKEGDIKQARISLERYYQTGDPYRCFECHMGLTDLSHLVRIKGRPVAMVLTGQFAPDDGTQAIYHHVERLGTAPLEKVRPDETARLELMLRADELVPMPADAEASLRREVELVEHIVEAAYEQRKRQWEQEFLMNLRQACYEPIECANRKQLARRLRDLLHMTADFCRCEYLAFFGSVQEGETVLTPIAATGSLSSLGDHLPHFNWRKAALSSESFDVRTRSANDWDVARLFEGIRGQNREALANAAHFVPLCQGSHYRGLLVLGPFAEPVRMDDEYRFLAETATILGDYALGVLESLYLREKSTTWETRARLTVHQMKTGLIPLTMNSAWIESLCREDGSDQRLRRTANLAKDIKQRALSLRDQANETLLRESLAHIEIESRILEKELKPDRYPLAVLVSNCAAGFTERAEEDGRRIVIDPSVEDLPMAYVDLGRLSIALGNLLENAVKYSATGTQIIVRGAWDFAAPGQRTGRLGLARIEVEDLGLPIDEEDRAALFRKGGRGKAAKTARIMGTGIGLWEAREIVRAHGGDLDFRCSQVGDRERSRARVVFVVTLPVHG